MGLEGGGGLLAMCAYIIQDSQLLWGPHSVVVKDRDSAVGLPGFQT